MTRSSRLHTFSFFHILTGVSAAAILFAAALLLSSVFASSALAQTDLNGENKTITHPGTGADWSTSFTNTNENLSTITFNSLNNGTRYTYSGALTGNIAVDITHGAATNNDNRFTFSSTGNTFTGGVTMHDGILFLSSGNLPANCALTLDNTVLMSSAVSDFKESLTIPAGSFAGLRPSAAMTYSGVISGSGDLLITTENANGVTLSGVNTYTGVTSIGTHKGGSTGADNNKAYLTLGANGALPSATVVEIALSQNPTYNFTGAAVANLDLNGTTQTIAGLYGGGAATITNGTAAAANLTINLPEGKSYEYSGTIAGNSATNLTNLTVTGAGNQTLSGNISNASLTKSGTGTLTLGGNTVSLSSLAVTAGTLAFTPNVNLTVTGNATSASTLDLNGANLTYTSNVATDFGNAAIKNTNTETQSVLTIAPSANVTAAQTFKKNISGNTRLVVKLPQNQVNVSRLILDANVTNNFTGGLYIEQGTVQVNNMGSLGSNKQIDIKHGSLMTSQTFEGYTINLIGTGTAERGAIRISGGSTFAAKITGVGSLEIVYDGECTLTNTANDYQGKTYLGNFQWRYNKSGNKVTGVSEPVTLNLGASGVLPDATVVVFGKDAYAAGTSGTQTLDLKGFDETVAGITNEDGNGVITSDSAAKLTVNANADYTYAGKVTGSATVEKQGTGTLTITGDNTGALIVSEGTLVLSGDNSGAQSITVKGSGILDPKTEGAMATTVNLQTTAFAYPDNKFTKNTDFVISESGTVISVPMTDLQSGTYFRQRFTGMSKDFQSYFTNPESISNMDKIANTAYVPGSANYFTSDIWGNVSGDENNTNLLMTKIVNTTNDSITLDFAYQFHNSAYLAISDSKGNRTIVMDWTNTASHTVDGGTYSYASNTGSYTFEPGETYTIEARIFRFNRTIGANGGGVNGFGGTLVGMGAKVSGTDGEYLPLNFNGDNWTFSDGSFVTSSDASFVASSVTINADATLSFNTQNNNFDVYSAFSGAGTLNVNPAEGFTHTYSGAIADTVLIAKSGEGTMTLSGDCNSVGSVTVEAGTLDVAFDSLSTELNIGSIAMAENTAFKVTQGTVTFGETDVVLNNLSGDNGAISVDGVLTLNNDQLTKYVGAISAQTIKKTGDETLQIYAAAAGLVSASSFVVSSGRLDMKEYYTGSLEVGEDIGNGSYTTAVLSPGNSVGTLTVDGEYTLNPGSTLLIEIGKDEQGNVIADKLIVNGEATFESGSIIDIVLDDASSLAGGETFEGVIITADNAASIFDDVKAAIRSYYFDITVTQSGNDISLTARLDPNAVPEPSTWALLALGVVVLFLRKRK